VNVLNYVSAYNSVNHTLFLREFNIFDFGVGRRKGNDRSAENGCFHGTSHHGVRKQNVDPSLTIICIAIAEITPEIIPGQRMSGF